MLTEFAFTPSIFDEDAHDDKEAWLEQLRELNHSMFPKTSVWAVIVSDLYAGSWFSHVEPHIESIQDHRAKRYCRDLLTNIQKMLVVRPECGDWPHDNDIAWCREAVATNRVELIERIVSVQSTKEAMVGEYGLIRSIDEVEDSGFWRGIRSDASPKMVIAEQVNLLRKLCLHSEWVALVSPYAFGTEQDFSLELLGVALNRHSSFGRIKFELHAQSPDVSDTTERQKREKCVGTNMEEKIGRNLAEPHSVDLYFWPKLLDRILIAGNYVRESGGKQRKSPRWGVSMSHVARGSVPNAPPTEWKLLPRESLDRWVRLYVAEDAVDKPAVRPISPLP